MMSGDANTRRQALDGLKSLLRGRLSGSINVWSPEVLMNLDSHAKAAAFFLVEAVEATSEDWDRAAEIATQAADLSDQAGWHEANALSTCLILLPVLAHAEHFAEPTTASLAWLLSTPSSIPLPWRYRGLAENLDTLAEVAVELGLEEVRERAVDPLLALLANRVMTACREGQWIEAAQHRGCYLRWQQAYGARSSSDHLGAWDQNPNQAERIGEQAGAIHALRMVYGALFLENFAADGAALRFGDARYMDPRLNEVMDGLAREMQERAAPDLQMRMAATADRLKDEARRGKFQLDLAVEDLMPIRHQFSPQVWVRFEAGYRRRNSEFAEEVLQELLRAVPDNAIGQEAARFPHSPLDLPHFTVGGCGHVMRSTPGAHVDTLALLERVVEHPDRRAQAPTLIDLALLTAELDEKTGQRSIAALLGLVRELYQEGAFGFVRAVCSRAAQRLGTQLLPSQQSFLGVYRDLADASIHSEADGLELLLTCAGAALELDDNAAADRSITLLNEALSRATTPIVASDIAARLLPALVERGLRQEQHSDMALVLALADAHPEWCEAAVTGACAEIAATSLASSDESAPGTEGRILELLPDLPELSRIRRVLEKRIAVAEPADSEAGVGGSSPSKLARSLMRARQWQEARQVLWYELEMANVDGHAGAELWAKLAQLAGAIYQCIEFYPETHGTLSGETAELISRHRSSLLATVDDDSITRVLRLAAANSLGLAGVRLHSFLPDGGRAMLEEALDLLEMAVGEVSREQEPALWSAYANNLALAHGAMASFGQRVEAVGSLKRKAELLEEVLALERRLARDPDPGLSAAGETIDITLLNLGRTCYELAEVTYDAQFISRKSLDSARWLRRAVETLAESASAATHAGRPEIAATAELLSAKICAGICERYVVERGWAGGDLTRAFYDWLCTVAGGHINTSEFVRLCGETALTRAARALKVGIVRNASLMLEAAEAMMQIWAAANREGAVWPYVGDQVLMTLIKAFEDLDRHGNIRSRSPKVAEALLELKGLAEAMFCVAWHRRVTQAADDLTAAHASFLALARGGSIVARAYARPRARWLEVQSSEEGLLVNGLYLGKAKSGLEVRIPSQRRQFGLGGFKAESRRSRLRRTEEVRRETSLAVVHLEPMLLWDDAPQEIAVAELQCSSGKHSFRLHATRLPLATWDAWLLEFTVEGEGVLRLALDLPLIGVYDIQAKSLDASAAFISNHRKVLVLGQAGLTVEVTLPQSAERQMVVARGTPDRPVIEIQAERTLLVLKSTPRITSADAGFFVKQDTTVGAVCCAASFPLIAPGHSFPSATLHGFAPLFFFVDQLPPEAVDLINQIEIREVVLVGLPEDPWAVDQALDALFDARRELLLLLEPEEVERGLAALGRLRQRIDMTIGGADLMRAATSGAANHDPLSGIQIVNVPRAFAGAAAQMLLDLAALRHRPFEGLPVQLGGEPTFLSVSGNPGGSVRELTLLSTPAQFEALVERYARHLEGETQMHFWSEEVSQSILDMVMPRLRRRPVFLFPPDGRVAPSLVPCMRHFGGVPVPASEDGIALLRQLQPPDVYVPESFVQHVPPGTWAVHAVPDAPADLAFWFQGIVRDAHAQVLGSLADAFPHLLSSRSLLEEMAPSEYVVLGVEGWEEAPWAYLAANYAAALGAPLLLAEQAELGDLAAEEPGAGLPGAPVPRDIARPEVACVARDILAQVVRRIPKPSPDFLGKTHAALLRMQPTYIGFVSSLASLPVELAGEPPLAMRFALGRIAGPDLTTTGILVARAALSEDVARPPSIRALVAEAAMALPGRPLPGARREVEMIYMQLSRQQDVDAELCTPDQEKLLERIQRAHLVHFAGHGVYDDANPALSGLLLPDGLLPVANFQEELKGAPIIFGNACESGRLHRSGASVGAKGWSGLAASFIAKGAVNYLGSLWPIFDDTSRRTAEVFYEGLCEGMAIGEALRAARRAVYSDNDPTWAAFVLFGCPRNRLRPQSRKA